MPKLWQRVKQFFSPYDSWSELDDRWYTGFWPQETSSGAQIDESNASSLTPVWACVKIISEDIASLPLHLYQRKDRGKERALQHPLYTLLHDNPNPEMTSMVYRETMVSHILTWGNHYSEIERTVGDKITALWPLPPNKVTPKRYTPDGQLYYELRMDDGSGLKIIPANNMLHVAGLSHDGIMGFSPIGKLREAIGLAKAIEEFGGRFFGAGTHPGAIVSHPGKLGPQAHENLKKSLSEGYSGLGKSHRLLLLEEGMKIEALGVPPEDAQFLETRKFQIAEIARIYRVPLHMIAELDKATFSNIEQQSLEYVKFTLRPWLVRLEQSYNRQLLRNPLDRKRYFWEHLVEGLLRGDTKTRYESYALGRNWGWLSADDIREMENMNPLPEGKGEIYLQPLNMIEAGEEPPKPEQPEIPPNNGNGRDSKEESSMEARCLNCDKLLFRGKGSLEIKCPKCGIMNSFTSKENRAYVAAQGY